MEDQGWKAIVDESPSETKCADVRRERECTDNAHSSLCFRDVSDANHIHRALFAPLVWAGAGWYRDGSDIFGSEGIATDELGAIIVFYVEKPFTHSGSQLFRRSIS